MITEASARYNHIENAKTFDVTSFITAHVFRTRPDTEAYWERYDFAQIFLVLKGSGTYTTEEHSYPISAGMMFYRPANRRSRYEWDGGDVQFALISFVCKSAAMEAIGEQPILLHEEESAALMDAICTAERICEPLKENEHLCGLRVKPDVPNVVLSFIYASMERFLAMIYCRLQNIELLLDESRKVNQYIDESRLVAEVKHYLAEHLAEQLTVHDICTHFGVSQTTLTRKFRHEVNQGLIEYFTELKIAAAKERIRKSASSFTEVSEALGFSSVNYFSKVFKAQTGMTPTEYSKHVSKRRLLQDSQNFF